MPRFFKLIYQQESMDCGSACLAMMARYYGCHKTVATIRRLCGNSRNGLSFLQINIAAQQLGFQTRAVALTLETLSQDVTLPCIIHWQLKHFIVVYKITRTHIYTADSAIGRIKYTYTQFQELWTTNTKKEGFALLLQPTERLLREKEILPTHIIRTFTKKYILPYWLQLASVLLLLISSTFLQSLLPFLTKAIVDNGIQSKDVHILVIILVAQVALTIGNTFFQFLQSRIVLLTGTRMNIAMTQDLLKKLVLLPIRFFDARQAGDILQRFSDQSRIEQFVTTSALNILLSITSLLVFGIILLHYHKTIFVLFFLSAILYILWITIFLPKRRIIDYERFGLSSSVQDATIQFVRGMQEIKLNNCSKIKMHSWTILREKLLNVNLRSLKLTQNIQAGGVLIIHIADAFILYIAASAVIDGQMSLGTMLAMQYITGSLRAPIENIVGFAQSVQDFLISMERTNYIHALPNEKQENANFKQPLLQREIRFEDVCFAYDKLPETFGGRDVIKHFSLTIPANKTTAIVGVSGGGKTTLLKLLLGFYVPRKGDIYIDDTPLKDIDIDAWRNSCGSVMQDGYIFSDTIKRNIALNDENPNMVKIKEACRIACIADFIEQLPLGYQTIIGADGIGLSTGQKQRILIARAVYKNPAIVLFDEATNSLDATNEHDIFKLLKTFLQKRTTIIVAHRLSTIRKADQIVVIEDGQIVEKGTHIQLIENNGAYAQLIKNQLK